MHYFGDFQSQINLFLVLTLSNTDNIFMQINSKNKKNCQNIKRISYLILDFDLINDYSIVKLVHVRHFIQLHPLLFWFEE